MPDDPKSDLNWGDDERVFPRLAAWLQKWTQITWLPATEPISLTVALFPPLVVVNFPLIWREAKLVPGAAKPLHPVLHLRAGWRRDMNSGEFYLSFAAKAMPRTFLW